MIEMLKARKEALQEQGHKGFTLMEMLIVIAIIAILVAIAIPIFADQLERAKQATDAANIRAAYSEAVANALVSASGSASVTSEPMQSASWDKLTNTEKIGSLQMKSIGKTVGQGVVVTANADGTVTAGGATTGGTTTGGTTTGGTTNGG